MYVRSKQEQDLYCSQLCSFVSLIATESIKVQIALFKGGTWRESGLRNNALFQKFIHVK
jgi:hypothetical protein